MTALPETDQQAYTRIEQYELSALQKRAMIGMYRFHRSIVNTPKEAFERMLLDCVDILHKTTVRQEK